MSVYFESLNMSSQNYDNFVKKVG